MPDLALPDALQTIDDLRDLHLEGGLSFQPVQSGTLTTIWTLDGIDVPLVWDANARTVNIPDGTDQARIDLLQATLDDFRALPKWDAGVRKLYQLAQSTVGVDVRNLTTNQQLILLAMALLNQRAFEYGEDAQGNATILVRPLGEWVRFKID